MNNYAINNFFQEARKVFKYLEDDFGYKFASSPVENVEFYPDTIAVVRYVSTKIGIEVYWYFASAVISVALIELLKENEFPNKRDFWGDNQGEARAIKLQTLLDMIDKSDKLVLKKTRSTMMQDIKKRGKLIDKNLGAVLENLARVLQDEAKDILLGDTSIFARVQKFESELLKKEYPY